jgi:hypothetical protein
MTSNRHTEVVLPAMHRIRLKHLIALACGMSFACAAPMVVPAVAQQLTPRTTLANPKAKFTTGANHAVLKRGDTRATVINNADGGKALPGHRAGYSGLGSLTHTKRPDASLFVPAYAGLNFEHIHDGTRQDRDILFEPRRAPMELRVINQHTAELYQRPTPHWGLESSLRYEMLPDGTMELTFECIPRRETFKHGYIGLFWASYINQPESLDIHFRGQTNNSSEVKWIRGVTPLHGVKSTHLAPDDNRRLKHDDDFPLTLVFNRSEHHYAEPWYFGVSHGMAFAQMFRPKDRVRLTQSPSGGGRGNPAWDFQFLIPDAKVGKRYRFVMRAMYLPFESNEQVQEAVQSHLEALKADSR